MKTSISIQVDTDVHAAYIRLSSEPVAKTVECNEHILVDLDAFGVAVGIELLDETTPLPFDVLMTDFHVHSDVVMLLRMIRPNVSTFVSLYQGTEGVAQAKPATELVPG